MSKLGRSLKIGTAVGVIVLSLGPVLICRNAIRHTATYYENAGARDGVALREFPYPFRCAATICSDVDGTNSLSEFLTIQEFLNTRNETPLGEGLGLEIGNTFFGKSNHFGFVSPRPEDRKVILDLLQAGYIDAIHSFDLVRTREEIEQVVDKLAGADATIDVWVNHGGALSNLGTCGDCFGDDAESTGYHSDFSPDRVGYEFVWLDAVSGIVGQGRPLSSSTFFDAFDRSHPLRSLFANVLVEQIKLSLSAVGISRYAMRRNNELVRLTQLDDGRPVFEFTRSNQCYDGLWGRCATAAGLADTLRDEILEALIEKGGYMIVYSHLGKNDGFPYLPEPTVKALRSLAEKSRRGEVWVATTSRLLNYYVNKKHLVWNVRRDGDAVTIAIDSTEDPVRGKRTPSVDDLGGLTFYVQDPDETQVLLNGQTVNVNRNPPDQTGRRSVTIPLRPLESLDARMRAYKSMGYF